MNRQQSRSDGEGGIKAEYQNTIIRIVLAIRKLLVVEVVVLEGS